MFGWPKRILEKTSDPTANAAHLAAALAQLPLFSQHKSYINESRQTALKIFIEAKQQGHEFYQRFLTVLGVSLDLMMSSEKLTGEEVDAVREYIRSNLRAVPSFAERVIANFSEIAKVVAAELLKTS